MALRPAGKPEIFYHKSVESGNETGKARFFALTVVSSVESYAIFRRHPSLVLWLIISVR